LVICKEDLARLETKGITGEDEWQQQK
jgi:hypothetical protein